MGGYMVYTGVTFKYIFDYHDNDVYWCTADIGWVPGHSYIVYGPLSQGATSLMFEGVPTYDIQEDRKPKTFRSFYVPVFENSVGDPILS